MRLVYSKTAMQEGDGERKKEGDTVQRVTAERKGTRESCVLAESG